MMKKQIQKYKLFNDKMSIRTFLCEFLKPNI